MGKQVKLLALIDRIDVSAPCPSCGNSMSLTHVPINTELSCSECGGKFTITDATEIRLPRVLRKFRVDNSKHVSTAQRMGCKRVDSIQRRPRS